MSGRREVIGQGYFERQAKELMHNLWANGANGDAAVNRGYHVVEMHEGAPIGEYDVKICTKFVEPAWERFEPGVDIYLDDEVVYGRDSRNIAPYRNEGFVYGTHPNFEAACAFLDEMLEGQECEVTDLQHSIAVDVSREQKHWENPDAVAELRVRSRADKLIGQARETADYLMDGYIHGKVREASGEGNDFVRTRRAFASELAKTFGHKPEHDGVPLTDAQSSWLDDIANAYGSIATDTASMGYVPAAMPPDIYDMSMAGVLTTDEAWQVIATAISTVPTELGDGKSHAKWPRELVDAEEAREIVSYYQSTSIEVRDRLVRDDKRHVGRKNVCLFMDDGSGIRKRYANLAAERIVDGSRDGYSRVNLPINVHVFGYDKGELVHEVIEARDVKAQMNAARATYARQRDMGDRTASTRSPEESRAMDVPEFSD